MKNAAGFESYRAKELSEVATIGNTARLKVTGDAGTETKHLRITTTELERIIALLEPKDYVQAIEPDNRVEFPELSFYNWDMLSAQSGTDDLLISRSDDTAHWDYTVRMFRREAWKVKADSRTLGRVYFELTRSLPVFQAEIEGQPVGCFDSLEHAVKFIINMVDGYGTEE